MNKQALTEALAFSDADSELGLQPDFLTIIAAARLVERLLPGECDDCKGAKSYVVAKPTTHLNAPPFTSTVGFQAVRGTCPTCLGSGRLWDEGIVEAVAKALYESWIDGLSKTPWLLLTKAEKVFWFQNAIAVLSAIAELLTEKVET